MDSQGTHGRGASSNPPNRFERLEYVSDEECPPDERPLPRTVFLRDPSRTIITTNDSPDVGFDASINPYRGCEHGCIYCFARCSHEYLGFSAGLDFETKIMVKEDAPVLLRQELSSPKWQPKVITISGVTDCYQPVERKLQLTRRCLEVLAEFLNPVAIQTKNHLVTRDADILGRLAGHDAAMVYVSLTTLDEKLARVMEPRTSAPRLRLEAIETLTRSGVPAGVMISPVIPGMNEHEIPAILEAAAAAGAITACYSIVRLPYAVAGLFEQWLVEHFPDRKDKVMNRIREIRDGRMNDSRWGSRLQTDSVSGDQVSQLFAVSMRKSGLDKCAFGLSTASFRRPAPAQGSLW